MTRFHTCRFCNIRAAALVRYSIRHFAHLECYLARGHELRELTPAVIAKLPAADLQRLGLLDGALQLAGARRAVPLADAKASNARNPNVPSGRAVARRRTRPNPEDDDLILLFYH